MDTNSTAWRKDAAKDYKARKPQRGTYAIRCAATGEVWIGTSLNADTAKNRIWSELRHGGSLNKDLQSAWNANGSDGFTYEILETLDDDVNPLSIDDLLKEQRVRWAKQLDARIIN